MNTLRIDRENRHKLQIVGENSYLQVINKLLNNSLTLLLVGHSQRRDNLGDRVERLLVHSQTAAGKLGRSSPLLLLRLQWRGLLANRLGQHIDNIPVS